MACAALSQIFTESTLTTLNNPVNQTKDIQTLASELSRLLEAKANLREFHDTLWDAGIKLEPDARAKKTVEAEIARVKAELKELL